MRCISSESLDVINDGAEMSKFEKIVALSQIPETYDTLRVCYKKPDGLMNCCRCGKCMNTMMTLDMCSVLHNYKTFPLPLDRKSLRTSELSYPSRTIFLSILNGALERKRYDLAVNMYIDWHEIMCVGAKSGSIAGWEQDRKRQCREI